VKVNSPVKKRRISIFIGRVFLVLVVPIALLALLEAGLRWGHVGVDPHFVIPDLVQGQPILRDNPDIGTLWFTPGLTRSPIPFSVPDREADVRIAIIGESAAMGDPSPAFGISVQLEAILKLLYPGKNIEVINAAMTAIDSSVIVQIARDVGRLKPDAVIVYMGNNEVVGPFGPAPGQQNYATLDANYARISLWIGSLRLGQLLRKLQHGHLPSTGLSWQGLSLFSDREISPSSTLLPRIHKRYAENLKAIIRIILSYDAVPIVGTMATRINWPPFASVSNNELAAAESLEASGQWSGAYYMYRQLLDLEPRTAEWNYRIARTSLAMGDIEGAVNYFIRSRDLDSRRFRVDSVMNQLVAGKSEQAVVIDLEDRFNQFWAEPGRFIWDHVHLTPDGNYVAAAAFARELIPILTGKGFVAVREIPALEEIRASIVYTDWDRLNTLSAMHQRFLRPPIDSISHHQQLIGELTAQITSLRKVVNRDVVEDARDRIQAAAGKNPRDIQLLIRLGKIYEDLGQHAEAFDVYETMVRLWPHVRSIRSSYGRSLVRAGRLEEGLIYLRQGEVPGTLLPRLVAFIEASTVLAEMGETTKAVDLLNQAIDLAPDYSKSWYNRAIIYSRTGQIDLAEKDFLQAVALEPGLPEAYNNLGVIALKREKTDQAVAYFKQALSYQRYHVSALRNLSLAAMMKGEWESSLKYSTMLNYLDPELNEISSMRRVATP